MRILSTLVLTKYTRLKAVRSPPKLSMDVIFALREGRLGIQGINIQVPTDCKTVFRPSRATIAQYPAPPRARAMAITRLRALVVSWMIARCLYFICRFSRAWCCTARLLQANVVAIASVIGINLGSP